MKKTISLVGTFLAILNLSATPVNLSLSYGSGLSTTATTISFNYSGSVDIPAVYFGGAILGRVYLDNGITSYFVGEFQHNASNGGTNCVVSPPCYVSGSGNPFMNQCTIPSGCAPTQNVTMTVPTSCIPNGTYSIRLDIRMCIPPAFELPLYSSCGITVGASYFPQTLNYTGHPLYCYLPDGLLGSANLGTFTTSSSGTFASGITPHNATCSNYGSVTYNITPGTAPYTIWQGMWSGTPTVTSSTNPTVNMSSAGTTFDVCIIDANGCRIDDEVNIGPPTQPTMTIFPANQIICSWTCVTFSESISSGTGYTYSWTHSNPTVAPHVVSTSASFCTVPPVSGHLPYTTNTYTLTVSNAYGCHATGQTLQTVNSGCTASTAACCLNIGHRIGGEASDSAQNDNIELHLFPNPASDMLTIEFKGINYSDGFVELYDVSGKLIRSVAIPEGRESLEVNVADMPAGTYLVKLSGEDKMLSEIFIKE
jgi:hypothetical protein